MADQTSVGARLLTELLEAVPRFGREAYPSTTVMDGFADAVRDRLRETGDLDAVREAFGWVETLAARQDPALDNLVMVCFLEAARWGELGARGLLGPWTRTLARRCDPRMIDTTML